ncbi:MAG: Cell division protein [Parcubacteria group bacterium GW2011_GWA1_54_88]|nr:MAG: Cell division protein [Parcubacteria group bacterium GW2011_GWA1_54_88]
MRSGFIGFWRNGTVSLAAIFAMLITLSVVGALMVGNVFLSSFLETVKEKVDVTLYFTIDAQEPDILALKKSLETLPEVNRVEYVTREQALLAFRERHKDDAVMLAALEEVGGNPLRASLNIKAKELSQYESVSKFLEGDTALSPGGENIIEKVNYRQNKIVIERMNTILSYTRRVGAVRHRLGHPCGGAPVPGNLLARTEHRERLWGPQHLCLLRGGFWAALPLAFGARDCAGYCLKLCCSLTLP